MILTDENGYKYNVREKDKIGQGGQGAVYRVTGNNKLAVKLMINTAPDAINEQQEDNLVLQDDELYLKYSKKIRRIEALNAVADIGHLAVPVAMLEKPNCGYIMRFMSNMTEIQKQMRRNMDNLIPMNNANNSLSKKMLILANTAKIISELNAKGLVYCDYSPGNIFVSEKPDSHEVWLIDLDNLHYSGTAKKTIGTPHYRAPEINNGTARQNTFESDIYSFALVAYEYLTYSSPFNGSMVQQMDNVDAWDAESDAGYNGSDSADMIDQRIEAGEVPYIDENMGNSRIPESGIPHEYVFTETLKELFLRTFCENGRKNPASRPHAIEWYEAFMEAYNQVTICSNHHTHLGTECIWCRLLGKSNPEMLYEDKNRYFRITVEDYLDYKDTDNWDSDESIPEIKPFNQYHKIVSHRLNNKSICDIPGYFFDSAVDAKAFIRNTSFELDLSLQKIKPSRIKWDYKAEPKDKCVLLKKNNKPFKVINIHLER